jgi:hypothetical protein
MALGSVHSGFSITEGKARMETDETFETLLSPHHNRPYPYLNPGGKFPRLSEKDIARIAGFAIRVFGVAIGAKIADRRGGGLRQPLPVLRSRSAYFKLRCKDSSLYRTPLRMTD